MMKESLTASAHLVDKANRSAQFAAYWCRGMLLQQCLPALPEAQEWEVEICERPAVATMLRCTAATDGSGGRQLRELMRASWAWVLVENGCVKYGRCGLNREAFQTVQRSELWAAIDLIKFFCPILSEVADPTDHTLRVYTDHLSIVRVCCTVPWPDTRSRANHDLWQLLQTWLDRCPSPVAIAKVKSHVSALFLSSTAGNAAPDDAYVGNEAADAAATVASDESALEERDIERYQDALAEWKLIVQRIQHVY